MAWRALPLVLVVGLGACGGPEPAPAPERPPAVAAEGVAEGVVTDRAADAVAPEPPAAAAEDADAAVREQVAKLLEIAREGALAKRPQAAQRLSVLGAPAVEALRAAAGGTPRELADLGPELLRPMAELGDDGLRESLWAAVDDLDYPFRPAATKWLAATARDGEWERFEALQADPLSAVRAAAVGAAATLDDRSLEPVVVAALADRGDDVRRSAADVLAGWGRGFALRWLLEDLARTDRYFEVETGKNARYEAARLLRRHLDDRALFGYEPREEPSSEGNVAALERLREAVETLAGDDPRRPPAHARASAVAVDGVLGLEVRSCRRGEFFLAVTADDRLVVGTHHPREYPLRPGAAERLAGLVQARFSDPAGPTMWGELGCDLECFRVRAADGTPLALRVMKGPEEVHDLRPAPLDELARALLAELPEGLVDAPPSEVARGLQDAAVFDRVLEEALESVGGEVR